MKEKLIETFRDHIDTVMNCKSQKELQEEISFIVYNLNRFDYSTPQAKKELIQTVQCLNRPGYHNAKIELAKLLTIELSLIKIRTSLGS